MREDFRWDNLLLRRFLTNLYAPPPVLYLVSKVDSGGAVYSISASPLHFIKLFALEHVYGLVWKVQHGEVNLICWAPPLHSVDLFAYPQRVCLVWKIVTYRSTRDCWIAAASATFSISKVWNYQCHLTKLIWIYALQPNRTIHWTMNIKHTRGKTMKIKFVRVISLATRPKTLRIRIITQLHSFYKRVFYKKDRVWEVEEKIR